MSARGRLRLPIASLSHHSKKKFGQSGWKRTFGLQGKMAAACRRSRGLEGLDGKIEDTVETLDKYGGILEWHTLHEKSLIQKQPCCVL
jgi:hypothetical protein